MPHFDRAVCRSGADKLSAIVVDAQDVALMPGKASVEVKCGLTLSHIPIDAVNLELSSRPENVDTRFWLS